MKKYELTDDFIEMDGVKLFRIRALKDFADVKTGDLGGYVQSYENLSQEGDCWIYSKAMVYKNAKVFGNATISGSIDIYDKVEIFENAMIFGFASIYGKGQISGNVKIHGCDDIW